MEEIKKQIIELLNNTAETAYGKGSCGELGDSFQAIDADYFSEVANDILKIIQIVFDPENQPNQLGIETPFKKDYSDFDKAVEPAIRYLFKNHHPHTKIYIDYSNAELLEGQRTHNLNEEVPD